MKNLKVYMEKTNHVVTLDPIGLCHKAFPLRIFFIFNTFCKLILNLILFFLKLTLLAAPIAMARRNACAAPCMVAWQEGDVVKTGAADG